MTPLAAAQRAREGAAGEKVLGMINDDTKIIPGHGPLGNKAELKAYVAMLKEVRQAVAALIAQGKNLDEVKAAGPSKAYDETWGTGFMNADAFLAIVYESLGGK